MGTVPPVSQELLQQACTGLMARQPALFHHASRSFVKLAGKRATDRVAATAGARSMVGVEEPLPLLATDGRFGVEFWFEIATWQLKVGSGGPTMGAIPAPMSLVGGVLCPQPDPLGRSSRSGRSGTDTRQLQEFSLELLIRMDTRWVGAARDPRLQVSLNSLDMVDLKPELLADDLACYVATTLEVGIVPRIRIALDCILFELGNEVNRLLTAG